MTQRDDLPSQAARRLVWPLRITWAGLWAERLLRAFWPLISIVLLGLAAVMAGVPDLVPVAVGWAGVAAFGFGGFAALVWGLRGFCAPRISDAVARVDATLPGLPLQAMADHQAIGAEDDASRAIWQAHLDRMSARAAAAKAQAPDLRLSSRDPFALRYMALLLFVMALMFGSVWRLTQSALPGGAGQGGAALAAGPSWEGWIQPPAYTGLPTLYLADQPAAFEVPQGSRMTLRLYGEVGALSLSETVSGRDGATGDAAQDFDIVQPGDLRIEGRGGAEWQIAVLSDTTPQIQIGEDLTRKVDGEFTLPFSVNDDYGVVAGEAEITLDLEAVTRQFGFALPPETREAVVLDLPMPISGDRRAFDEELRGALAEHPWAGLPVQIVLRASDAAGNTGRSGTLAATLPGRRFFDPLAAALIDQRAELLWNRENAARAAMVLRAVSWQPEQIFADLSNYLPLRTAIRQLETSGITAEVRDEVAQALWDIAVAIEDGNLADALAQLRRAQDRLAEAMREGATSEEIAELMQELREAMQNYMDQLAQQSEGMEPSEDIAENSQSITGDQLEQMLQQLQELMEQGRTAEAQQLLDQLRQMMENMRMAQGQQGQQGPGQQAMEDLAETLREQQGLNDQTFGELQEQFGRNGQQGQPGQPGQDGADGQSLADRQQALRDQLEAQRRGMPGGEGSGQALDRAGRAMDRAEDALRDGDLSGALDQQAEAMDALRDGIDEMAREMAEQNGQAGQQGDAFGQNGSEDQQDPLGRESGARGAMSTDEALPEGEDVYRRAQELLDEIRRRSSDVERDADELEYLRRLLDQF